MLFRQKPQFIIAGLGNPGEQYAATRHNCGYEALDYIAAQCGAAVKRKKFEALTGTALLSGQPVLLMKPLTYMNLSGSAVGAAARYYGIPAAHVLVLCDDINLPCGAIRIRPGGSAGGHNGLKSIIVCLSGEGFPRIRIGVGRDRGDDLRDFVLERPSAAERQLITGRHADIYAAAQLILSGDTEGAMSHFNSFKR